MILFKLFLPVGAYLNYTITQKIILKPYPQAPGQKI